MFKANAAFSGFSVNNLEEAKKFYTDICGLQAQDDAMGLKLTLPGSGAEVFIYQKDDHQPATFTILNLVVDSIDDAMEQLKTQGAEFEQYQGLHQDEKGIARGLANNMGPDIAWFKDPSGNVVAILQNK